MGEKSIIRDIRAFCRMLPVAVALMLGQTVSAQNTDAIKITFLSWITGSTKVSYEHAFPSIGQSGELCASLISIGFDKYKNDPFGFTVRYGHKFFLLYNSEDHPLRGFYVRPEAIWSHYTYTSSVDGYTRELSNMLALIASAGIQWDFGHFIADAWFGSGPAIGKAADTLYQHGFELWQWFGSVNEHIAMSFTVRIGYCF